MDLKEKIKLEIEFIKIKVDIIHKKVLILLSASAGSGALIFKDLNTFWLIIGVVLLFFFSFGLFTNYRRLNKLNLEIEDLKLETKRILNARN